LGDIDRARAIYELAVNQQRLDMPEVLWKSFIDFETLQGETEKARKLYERLLERTNHFKVIFYHIYYYYLLLNVISKLIKIKTYFYMAGVDELCTI